jgi:hypothetical protein
VTALAAILFEVLATTALIPPSGIRGESALGESARAELAKAAAIANALADCAVGADATGRD